MLRLFKITVCECVTFGRVLRLRVSTFSVTLKFISYSNRSVCIKPSKNMTQCVGAMRKMCTYNMYDYDEGGVYAI